MDSDKGFSVWVARSEDWRSFEPRSTGNSLDTSDDELLVRAVTGMLFGGLSRARSVV